MNPFTIWTRKLHVEASDYTPGGYCKIYHGDDVVAFFSDGWLEVNGGTYEIERRGN